MDYNISQKFDRLSIWVKMERDIKKWEWVNFFVIKKHIKWFNEFYDLDLFTRLYFNLKEDEKRDRMQ